MTWVIDASVVIKWLFDDPENERYTALATALMAAVVAGDVEAVQPQHWLIEVGAVLARETPVRSQRDRTGPSTWLRYQLANWDPSAPRAHPRNRPVVRRWSAVRPGLGAWSRVGSQRPGGGDGRPLVRPAHGDGDGQVRLAPAGERPDRRPPAGGVRAARFGHRQAPHGFQELPWFWGGGHSVVCAPGVSAFKSGVEYAHGGLSLQEALTLTLTVRADGEATTAVQIESAQW